MYIVCLYVRPLLWMQPLSSSFGTFLKLLLICCLLPSTYFSPLTHVKKTPCKYLHSHILLMLPSLTLHGHSEWFPSAPWAVCPPLHPPSSWQACLTYAPPLPIHQDCSCISHTQVQPLDIEEHYEDTSHQFLVSRLETLSAQRQVSPWCSSITSPLFVHHLFVMRMNVPLIENQSTCNIIDIFCETRVHNVL